MNIVTHTGKHRMRPRLDDEIQITWGSAVHARVALACQANPLPIPRSRLDPKLQRLPLRQHAFAMAGRAGVLHLTGSPTPWALDIELHPSAHLRHLP